MIISSNIKSVYEKHKTELRLLMALDKPVAHQQLEFGFTDSKGINYNKFPTDTAIPIERWGKLNEFMMWMSAGLTSGELDKLLNVAEEAIAEGLKKDTRNIAKISTVINQIRERKNMVIHTELFYNYVAVQLVRQDEDPNTFNNEIQLQKVEQFKSEVQQGNCYDFFFKLGLAKLNSFMDMSSAEWERFWANSLQEQNLLNETVNLLKSKKESETGKANLKTK